MAGVVCPACGSRYGRRSTRCALDDAALVPLPDPLVGRALAGRYRITAPLGAGAMAVVYDAVDLRDGSRVAVKVPDPEVRDDEVLRARFLREGSLGVSVRHPRVAATLDVGDDGASLFLVMERLDGDTLAARLTAGPLSVADAAVCGAQLADALDALHTRGVVHRDLKPSNVFLVGGVGAPLDARLLDLGVARIPDGHPLTVVGAAVGTARTMSPEQARGAPATPASDLYALGVVLYECLTGAALFRGNDLAVRRAHLTAEAPRARALRPDTPDALDALVAFLLAKDPAARPASAAVARGLLLRLVEDPAGATEHLRASHLRAPFEAPARVAPAAVEELRRALDALTAHAATLLPALDRVAHATSLDAALRAGDGPEAALAELDEARRDALDGLRRDGVTRAALRAHLAYARDNALGVARVLAEALTSVDDD